MSLRFRAVVAAKRGVKLALLPASWAGRERRPGLFVLIYHRVGSGAGLELDVTEVAFRKQMEWVRDHALPVGLAEGLARLASGPAPERDMVAVTFDDGYRDVAIRAWPILRDLALPATVFLATGFVEGTSPPPLSRAGSPRGDLPVPMTWDQVGEMAASGLVAVGSHSHTHPDFDRIGPTEAEDELARAVETLRRRLGFDRVETFAYPRAVVAHEAVVARWHRWAVAGTGGKNLPGFVPTRVARTPVRGSDGVFFFRQRLAGGSPLEDRLYARLRGRSPG